MRIEFIIKEPDNMCESNLNTLFYYIYNIKQFYEISDDEYHKSEDDIRNYNLLINKTINLLKDMEIKIIK